MLPRGMNRLLLQSNQLRKQTLSQNNLNLTLAAKPIVRLVRNISWPWKSTKNNQKSFGSYEVIEDPGPVSLPHRLVPQTIKHPPYGRNIEPTRGPQEPEVKSSSQIESMRASCSLARRTLNYAKGITQAGVTTDEIDCLVHEFIISHGAYPSPLLYKNFPKSICTSVNNVICHGIPDSRALRDGDIINIDVTVYLNGFHGDVSETLLVGNVDEMGRKLVDTTKKCLEEAISICQPGRPFNHIGAVIESLARKNGFRVVPAFTGHGIGEYFHGAPDIFHCRNSYPGRMKAGQTFTIEPAIAQGTHECVILEDGWTAVTADRGRSAQFEHTVLITDNGVEVLTQ